MTSFYYTENAIMNYKLTTSPLSDMHDCLVLGVFDDNHLPDFAVTLNQAELARLCLHLKNANDIAWQTDFNGKQLLIIHCGSKQQYTSDSLSKHLAEIISVLCKQHIASATICMPQLISKTPDWQLQHMLLQIDAQNYQLLDFKSQNKQINSLTCVSFYLQNTTDKALISAQAIAASISLTRTLANLPANIATPSFIAKQALLLSEQHETLTTTIHNREDMQKMGMGCLLAVAQGSHEPPQLVELHYKGTHDAVAPIVLVGKGITFDAGGISLKPADGMNEMKYDMAGSATVLGVIDACVALKLPVNVIGLLACAENMPGGGAVKPGDIVTSMSGKTIEIINTDAEGRLVLADALTYAEQFNPSFVIDIATLTGAVIVALGSIRSAIMTQDDELATMLLKAAGDSCDKAWRLPLDEAYQEALDSPIADMVNSSFDRSAGSIVAGRFLSQFTKKYRWAHLDIAGTAWISGKKRCATGRPVALLVAFLQQLAHNNAH